VKKISNPKKLFLIGEASSFQAPNYERDDGIQNVNLNEPPTPTNQEDPSVEKQRRMV
ncbi:hypothetical protein HAX54_049047, partial [Datura stramonium]|nr:hypothetical protein [Datura stramonium]